MLETILQQGLFEMGIPTDAETLCAFRSYYTLLEETNRVMNLTAISGEEDSVRLHFLDSAAPLLLQDFSGLSVIDVGTGAGFPGLPLKILCPEMRLTLLDSLGKRVNFLQTVCNALSLSDVCCLHARAEECGKRREVFDVALSRAVARLNVLCELCLPYVKPGGVFYALKGPALGEELADAKSAIETLGGSLERVFPYTIPGTDTQHNIAVICKISATPRRYPRPFAQIKKSPL